MTLRVKVLKCRRRGAAIVGQCYLARRSGGAGTVEIDGPRGTQALFRGEYKVMGDGPAEAAPAPAPGSGMPLEAIGTIEPPEPPPPSWDGVSPNRLRALVIEHEIENKVDDKRRRDNLVAALVEAGIAPPEPVTLEGES